MAKQPNRLSTKLIQAVQAEEMPNLVQDLICNSSQWYSGSSKKMEANLKYRGCLRDSFSRELLIMHIDGISSTFANTNIGVRIKFAPSNDATFFG